MDTLSPEVHAIVITLIQIFATFASAMVPIAIGFLTKKWKLEGDLATQKKLEGQSVDLVLAIEEWAAAKKKSGEVIDPATKLMAFSTAMKTANKKVSDAHVLTLANSALAKTGLGASGSPVKITMGG